MDKLPLELFYHLFEYLDLDELFNLRLTCKEFNEMLKEFRIRELRFFDPNIKTYDVIKIRKRNWFYSNQLVNPNNLINISKSFILNPTLFNVNHLKRLKIYGFGNSINYKSDKYCYPDKDNDFKLVCSRFNLQTINKFNQLEHLEMQLGVLVESIHLELTNLKILKIYLPKNFDSFIEINAPILQALKLSLYQNAFELIKFCHPQSVQYLSINVYNSYFLIFKNITCLVSYFAHKLDSNVLSNYTRLNELHFQADYENVLAKIVQQNLNNGLKIYMSGVRLVDGKIIDDVFKNNEESFLFKNYSNLEDCLDFIYKINYSKSMRLVNTLLPDFFKKLNNIKEIYIDSKVNDQNNFIQFIEQCQNLTRIAINNSELNQLFYGNLPSICSIDRLCINEAKKVNLNFKFINRMFNLIDFDTNQQLDLNDISNLARLRYLKKIRFEKNGFLVLAEAESDVITTNK